MRKNQSRLLLGNWKVLTLTGKELKSVKMAEKYYHNVGNSFTERRGSEIVDLDGELKLFYSGADPSMSARTGVGILTNPQLSECVFDWIPWGPRACMLKL